MTNDKFKEWFDYLLKGANSEEETKWINTLKFLNSISNSGNIQPKQGASPDKAILDAIYWLGDTILDASKMKEFGSCLFVYAIQTILNTDEKNVAMNNYKNIFWPNIQGEVKTTKYKLVGKNFLFYRNLLKNDSLSVSAIYEFLNATKDHPKIRSHLFRKGFATVSHDEIARSLPNLNPINKDMHTAITKALQAINPLWAEEFRKANMITIKLEETNKYCIRNFGKILKGHAILHPKKNADDTAKDMLSLPIEKQRELLEQKIFKHKITTLRMQVELGKLSSHNEPKVEKPRTENALLTAFRQYKEEQKKALQM